MNQVRESVRQRTLFRFYAPFAKNFKSNKSAAESRNCLLPQEHTMPKFFRKITKKIKGPWPDTGAGARMNPKISLLCGSLALAIMGLAAIRVTYSL